MTNAADTTPGELSSVLGYGIVVEKDRLTVRYTAEARHSNDVGAVQASKPVHARGLVWYFEATVMDAGKSGKIAIGFSEKGFKLTRQPGWEPGSWGYHGDDGKKFHANGQGEEYGPKYGAGDTIGAGLLLAKREMFFTKNGVRLKTAFRNVRGVLYPTVGLHSKNECVEVNFGAKPFKFDLQGLIADESAALRATISQVPLPPDAALHLVCQYLGASAYADTLRALQAEAGGTDLTDGASAGTPAAPPPPPPQPVLPHCAEGDASSGAAAPMATDDEPSTSAHDGSAWLDTRQRVRLAILRGDVEGALSILRSTCPQVLAHGSGYEAVQYALYSQQFIELIRAGRVMDALEWGRTMLAPLRSAVPQADSLLRDVGALLAYTHPQESPLSALLGDAQRHDVADAVNGALLAAAAGLPGGSAPPEARLLRVLKHVMTLQGALLDASGGLGEPFSLHDLLPPAAGQIC